MGQLPVEQGLSLKVAQMMAMGVTARVKLVADLRRDESAGAELGNHVAKHPAR